MTRSNRLRLVAGTLVVLLIVLSATDVFTKRQSQAVSVSANIVALSYGVGVDYPGLVVQRFVKPGDTVSEHEPLFTIQSLQIARDVETGALDANRDGVCASGELVVRAAVAGTIESIEVAKGGYVASGVVVATIARVDSLSAQAMFVLAPRDFGRIEKDASVSLMLPNQREVHGTVTGITVETVDGKAHVTATIATDGLIEGDDNGLIRAGTPLQARLHLRDDGPLAGIKDAVKDLIHQVGM